MTCIVLSTEQRVNSKKFVYQDVPFYVNICQLITGRYLSYSFSIENRLFTGLDRPLGLQDFEAPRISR